jgi:hypothetical protein
MAESESEESQEPSPESKGKEKDKLAKDWDKMKGWQKAGVLIGAAALLFVVWQWWSNRSANSAAPAYAGGNLPFPNTSTQSTDTFPPPQPTPTPTPTPGPTPTPSPPPGNGETPVPFPTGGIGSLGFNQAPSLLPSGWAIGTSGGGNYAKGDILGIQQSNPNNIIDLTQLYGINNFEPGGGGRIWYRPPGSQNQQLLTGPGATGILGNPPH